MLSYKVRKTYLRIPDPDPIYERNPSYVIDLWADDWIIAYQVGPCFSSAKAAHDWAKSDPNMRTITNPALSRRLHPTSG